jgi:hypothetical protein
MLHLFGIDHERLNLSIQVEGFDSRMGKEKRGKGF